MKILRDRMETELVAKLALTLRNRDDLLSRLEGIETEIERVRIDTSERVSKAEEKLGVGEEAQGQSVKSLAKLVQQLEKDVRISVDRAIRDLESTNLR